MVNQMFFAHQIVSNSCATHVLLSVLLNCSDIDLGLTLGRLKEFSAGINPDSGGLMIANMAELACAHKIFQCLCTSLGAKSMSSAHALLPETYHFVSYVPSSV